MFYHTKKTDTKNFSKQHIYLYFFFEMPSKVIFSITLINFLFLYTRPTNKLTDEDDILDDIDIQSILTFFHPYDLWDLT